MVALSLTAAAAGSTLPAQGWNATFQLRSFYDRLESSDGVRRFGFLQAGQWAMQGAWSPEPVTLAADASLFGALKLDGGGGAGNRAYVGSNGRSRDRAAWAYLGEAALSARGAAGMLKLGLQRVNNPFLEPDDSRALPPTFRGLAGGFAISPETRWEAGRFHAVIARGHDRPQSLATSYGGTPVTRFDYAGLRWQSGREGAQLFAGRAQDVWRQYYFSVNRTLLDAGAGSLQGKLSAYVTSEDGRQRQGAISNRALSASLSASTAGTVLTLGLQRILGDQYFDYLAETNGILLANVFGADYNAPNERSVQLRLRLDGRQLAIPQADLTVWAIHGWGVNAEVEAARHANPTDYLHGLYWRQEQPIAGSHGELGIRLGYGFTSGRLKQGRLSLLAMSHRQTAYYPSKDFTKLQIVLQLPPSTLFQ
ncbi:OprD family porin [Chitinimonas naiadis]